MKQGVLTNGRLKLLMVRGTSGFKGYGRRNGERRRKSVRGCIVSSDLATLNLTIVKQGEKDLPGLTDGEKPRMRGPKRASKIRKARRGGVSSRNFLSSGFTSPRLSPAHALLPPFLLLPLPLPLLQLFNLSKEDDVRKYVNTYRRTWTNKNGKTESKAPKIQRLVTPATRQRKRHRASLKKRKIQKGKDEAGKYHALLQQRAKEQHERRSESMAKRRALRTSQASADGAPAPKK